MMTAGDLRQNFDVARPRAGKDGTAGTQWRPLRMRKLCSVRRGQIRKCGPAVAAHARMQTRQSKPRFRCKVFDIPGHTLPVVGGGYASCMVVAQRRWSPGAMECRSLLGQLLCNALVLINPYIGARE